jgi:hypothetical protein
MKVMKNWRILLIGIVFLTIFVSLASSEVYKWKDKDGNVFYSDSPGPLPYKLCHL